LQDILARFHVHAPRVEDGNEKNAAAYRRLSASGGMSRFLTTTAIFPSSPIGFNRFPAPVGHFPSDSEILPDNFRRLALNVFDFALGFFT